MDGHKWEITIVGHRIVDELTGGTVHIQHVMVDAANLRIEVGSNRRACCNVRLHDVANDFNRVAVLENGSVLVGFRDNLIPGGIGQLHQVLDQPILECFLTLSRDHVATCFVESVNLLGRKIHGDLSHVANNLFDEWLILTRLECHEMPSALVGDLDESIAGHILDTLVRLVHELEKLVDHRFQELPVRLQESRVLAHDVHDIAGYHSLVVFATLLLRQAKKILDDGDQEPLFGFLIHGTGDGADRPAQGVAIRPGPLRPVYLLRELVNHDSLSVDHVQMGEINQALSNGLVKLNGITLLHEFAHNLALVVLNDQNFLGADHLLNHDSAQV